MRNTPPFWITLSKSTSDESSWHREHHTERGVVKFAESGAFLACLDGEETVKAQLRDVWGCPQIAMNVVEPYRTVLCTHFLLAHADANVMIYNESLHVISLYSLDVEPIRELYPLARANHLSLMASLGFDGAPNMDANGFQTRVVPCPRSLLVLELRADHLDSGSFLRAVWEPESLRVPLSLNPWWSFATLATISS